MNMDRVQQLYRKYYDGDRERSGLFTAFANWSQPERVLYPGSFIHVAASYNFSNVTYVDTDRQARKFFAAKAHVIGLIEDKKTYTQTPEIDYIPENYEHELKLPDEGFDLLISLYAGFISKPCKRYLKNGGFLLVNNSHADAGLAALDPEYTLVGVVLGKGNNLYVSTASLDDYLIPKKEQDITEAYLRAQQRGIGYTKPATAYVFQKTIRVDIQCAC